MKSLSINLILALSLFVLAACGDGALPPTEPVQTQQGLLQGVWTEDEGIAHFMGAPYAAAPDDDLRWRAPQPAEAWQGVRAASSFGPQCAQDYDGGQAAFFDMLGRSVGLSWLKLQIGQLFVALAPTPDASEDCLTLNIRTGNLDGETKQPVMVWIHGGGHQNGSGADDPYQSNTLVKKGVVLVTINYRLGVFGYFAHAALSAESENGVSGNYGLLDQIAALEWVKANIDAFGGDPGNVTIFGESAGAQAVSEIMASPLSRSLFHRAIGQSGGSTGSFVSLTEPLGALTSAADNGAQVGAAFGASDVQQLRAIPAQDLIAYVHENPGGNSYYHPIIDGYVLPKSIGAAFSDGDTPNVPYLLGYNADEGTLLYPFIQSPTIYEFQAPSDPMALRAVLQPHYGKDTDELMRLYGLDNADTLAKGSADMIGDDLFGVNMRFIAAQKAGQGASVFLYFFRRLPPAESQTAGAFHAAEVPFVFGTHNGFFEATPRDWELTETMGTYWTNFARTGDPNDANSPVWPRYDRSADVWLTLNHEIKTEFAIRAEKLDILERALVAKIEVARASSNNGQHATVTGPTP